MGNPSPKAAAPASIESGAYRLDLGM